MSGFTQYLMESPSAARRCTMVTLRARAIQLERRFGGRVLAADDDHALAVERVRRGEVVRDVRQILAGHADQVGEVVGTGRQHDRAASDRRRPPRSCCRLRS